MAGENHLENVVKGLVDSPGGALVSDVSQYLKSRIKLLVASVVSINLVTYTDVGLHCAQMTGKC